MKRFDSNKTTTFLSEFSLHRLLLVGFVASGLVACDKSDDADDEKDEDKSAQDAKSGDEEHSSHEEHGSDEEHGSNEEHGTDEGDDESGSESGEEGDTPDPGPVDPSRYPALFHACDLGPATPSRFAFSATDGSTGSAGLVDINSKNMKIDLALAETDTAFSQHGDHLFLINRFGFDSIDVLDLSSDLDFVTQFSVGIEEDRSSNPHQVHVTDEEEAYVTLFGDDALQVYDFSDPSEVSKLRDVDFSEFSDSDGLPEVSKIIPCGNIAFFSIERLNRDEGWAPVGKTLLVPMELGTDTFFDWTDDHEGADGLELLGNGVKQVRMDPESETGHEVLILGSGLERVDLATGTSEWVIEPSVFSNLGIAGYQLTSFALHESDGAYDIYIVGANADWSAFEIYRGALDGEGEDLEVVIDGLQTTNGSLEIVGDEAWFADTTVGSSGLRIYDLKNDPPTMIGEPLSTGLPPYRLFPLE